MGDEHTPTDTVLLKHGTYRGQLGPEFDRWLTAHDREVAEKAWDEACKAFTYAPPPSLRPTDTVAFVASTNPYREGASE